MSMYGPRRITIEVDFEFYERWRAYLYQRYEITPAGRFSKIREFNTAFFRDLMEKEMEKFYGNLEASETIEDGFGNKWCKKCPLCRNDSMEIVRPGVARCSICESTVKPVDE
jgi:hypothetical protein